MLTETSPGLHVQWSLFSQDCNTHICGQISVARNFHSIKTDKYGCGGSSVFVCGQKNMAKITGAFSAVVAKTLKIITIRNLTVIR
jgi:hypothetical protein